MKQRRLLGKIAKTLPRSRETLRLGKTPSKLGGRIKKSAGFLLRIRLAVISASLSLAAINAAPRQNPQACLGVDKKNRRIPAVSALSMNKTSVLFG